MNPFNAEKRPIRVLAVDDSAVMRGVLRSLFQQHRETPRRDLPGMELCGIVEDGMECLAAIIRLRPDIVVLDLEMPRMHGLDVLERVRVEHPGLPVIMCSSYTERGARITLDALAHGAADYVMKPSQQAAFSSAMEALAGQLLPKIAALAGVGFEALAAARGQTARRHIAEATRQPILLGSSLALAVSGGPCLAQPVPDPPIEIVVVAVSTGGPSALDVLLPGLPAGFPAPIMVVQHMPKIFTGALAERLDRGCSLRVREAYDGAELHPGAVWLAPGDAHMEVALREPASSRAAAVHALPVIRLHQQPALNHCKPSADYLFASAARIFGARTLGLVMTGMGSDGLAGSWRIHEAGGAVLTQDRQTSAVWGMPGRVFEAGISREPLPLSALAAELTRRVQAGRTPQPAAGPRPAQFNKLDKFAATRPNEVSYGLL